MAEVVRTPIGSEQLRSRRSLDERLFIRWPRAYAALSRAGSHLPPRSRLRRALLRRTVLSGWSAWARGDLDLLLVRYAPHYRFEPQHELVAAGMRNVYEGHAGIREVATDVREAWERMDYTPLEIVDAGDPVVILGHFSLRASGSGIEFEGRVAAVYWAERGLVVRERQFSDWDEALSAAAIPMSAAANGRAFAA